MEPAVFDVPAAANGSNGHVSRSLSLSGVRLALAVSQIATVSGKERRTVGENRLVAGEQPSRQRYLVRHDYGMGALWWWITAGSAAEITTTFAEVEVIDDPAVMRIVQSWSLDELDIADAACGPLADLYRRRERQRRDPAVGKPLGKNRVYLRLPDPEDPAAWWLTEHDPAGRRVRQVELRPDGTAVASSAADWPMNPPFDLGDPNSP